MAKKIKIGKVVIDSGCLILTDPGNVCMEGKEKTMNETHIVHLLRVMGKEGNGGEIGCMVAVATGMGDGAYDVIAHTDEYGFTKKLEIIFIEE